MRLKQIIILSAAVLMMSLWSAASSAQTADWTAVISISDAETGVVFDSVCLMESELLSPEDMLLLCQPKQMNDSVNLYISAEQPLQTLATDNVHNTCLGFACAQRGTYVIHFQMAHRVDWSFTDLKTNVQLSMRDAASYQYTSLAVSQARRFLITTARGETTDLESVSPMHTSDAVYDLLGRCVGTIDRWTMLPRGIYIVNGRKMMK